MFKKSFICGCAIAALLLSSTGVFAGSAAKPNTVIAPADAIEIISPKLGSKDEVLLKKDSLYVNIRLKADYRVFMSLYKIDPPFYLGNSSGADNGQTIESVDGMTDAEKQAARPVVLARYMKAKNNLVAAKQAWDAAPANAGKKADYLARSKEFEQISAVYKKLFARQIGETVEVKVSDVIPYFKTEIGGVKPGVSVYQLVFTLDKPAGKVVKVVEFTATSSEDAVDKIADTVPDNMSSIWTAP